MLIHCTKKLAVKLAKVSADPLTDTNCFGAWHANLYTLDRRNCVLFCHDQTRFSLFKAGLKKDDFTNLDYWFPDLLANVLLKSGYETELIENALDLLDPLQFDTHCDRSVQGTMRVTAFDLEAFICQQFGNVMEAPIYSTSVHLNQRPVTVKGQRDCIWPDKAMGEWLDRLAQTLH
ncbi:MAG: hypothetical protein KZQ94_21885 [Candidatus Thiodiazotropha sp. (ex Troendleina suluensis)]|nr:hypothetical protein [Candidatus Thiodiazotropha sp. (ex Troendleina suluensis)]